MFTHSLSLFPYPVPYADVFSLLGQPIDIEGSFYNMSPRKRSPEYPIECSPRSKESKASMENSPFSPYLSEITTDTVFHPSSPESGVDMLSSTTRASFSSHTSLSFSPVLRNNTEMKLLLDEQPERVSLNYSNVGTSCSISNYICVELQAEI